MVYESSPHRPKKITDADKMAADVMIDDNTRLVLSLDILYTNEEEIDRVRKGLILLLLCNNDFFPTPVDPSGHTQWGWSTEECLCTDH